ncbi:hypothetical protein QQ045_016814 [Rhodiola kirilowii]
MVVTHLKNKRDTCKGYVFEYVADEEGTLTRLFWADSRSTNDRKMFVDVVSFDATYSTNKYNLVFVPFTDVDNHKCSVTLAIGLISNEDEDSYTWLLECFRKSIFHIPNVLVTDQEPAMKVAIAKTFPESTHRFCMWHIAEKMKAKVGVPLCSQTDFMKNISTAIWTDHIDAADFEEQWKCVIKDMDLKHIVGCQTYTRLRLHGSLCI